MNETLAIGQFARRVGLNTSAIRYDEVEAPDVCALSETGNREATSGGVSVVVAP